MKPFLFYILISVLFISCQNQLSHSTLNENDSIINLTDNIDTILPRRISNHQLYIDSDSIIGLSDSYSEFYPPTYKSYLEEVNLVVEDLKKRNLTTKIDYLSIPYKILSRENIRFDRKKVNEKINNGINHHIAIEIALNYSNLKDDINNIFKKINHQTKEFQTEKAFVSYKKFKPILMNGKDSVTFPEEYFIGMLYITFERIE